MRSLTILGLPVLYWLGVLVGFWSVPELLFGAADLWAVGGLFSAALVGIPTLIALLPFSLRGSPRLRRIIFASGTVVVLYSLGVASLRWVPGGVMILLAGFLVPRGAHPEARTPEATGKI